LKGYESSGLEGMRVGILMNVRVDGQISGLRFKEEHCTLRIEILSESSVGKM
jgi:hypothetical protein